MKLDYGEQAHEHLDVNLEPASIKGLETFKDFLFQHGFLKQNFRDHEAEMDEEQKKTGLIPQL